MESHYKSYIQNKKPAGSIFFAKPEGCTITAYQSGKVLFQGKTAESEADQWQTGQQKTIKPKAEKKRKQFALPDDLAGLSMIGSDEVGTGDYFGPITVVAAFVSSQQMEEVRKHGVKDSKLLNDTQIVTIAKKIIPHVPYSLLTLDNKKYNELKEQGMSQVKMKALLHNKALQHTINKIGGSHCDGILIDQFAPPGAYFSHLKGESKQVRKNVYFATKAESLHLSVAAASIIARYALLQEFEQLSEKAGMRLPKGAGNQVDEAAARLINRRGEDVLPQFAKVHFANTQKAKKLVKR